MALFNHTSNSPQLVTYLGAHYLASLIANVPSLIGSLAAIGNPLGLVRGLGDGVRYVPALPLLYNILPSMSKTLIYIT